MRIALLSDVHGNALALSLCLERIKILEPEQIYFLGDAVGYFPGASEVLSLLRSFGVECQKGNHEAMLLGHIPFTRNQDRIYGIEAARASLSPADYAFIESWPERRELEADGKRVLFVHGSPENPLEGYVYPDGSFEWLPRLEYDAVFCGHSHRPFVAEFRGKIIATVGSCGLPRDQGDQAAFAVYDSTTSSCEVFRVKLDVAAVLSSFGDNFVAPEVRRVLERKSALPFGRQI